METVTLTKRELALRIANETEVTAPDVLNVIQKLFDHITEELAVGNRFEFRRFGVFETITRRSRIGRNPKKPADTVVIPERRVVKFTPGNEMRDLVLQKSATKA